MPLFQKGSRLGSSQDADRWLVTRKIGEGQFAEVYEVKDLQNKERDARYAVKIEKRKDLKTVKVEYKILKKLCETCHQVCEVTHAGVHDDRFYIVMQLLGLNLAEARKAVGGRYDAALGRTIAFRTLDAIQAVHAAGFIHRDVKPANFALHPPYLDCMQGVYSGEWKIIDFGLARRYIDEAGEVLPERTDTSFRGSTMYASVHAHAEADLGRRDDLWSWLYCMVELLDGTLPWRTDKDPDQRDNREFVYQLKRQCIEAPATLARHVLLPEPLVHISNHLRDLGFADMPNYDFIRQCLAQLPEQPQQMQQTGLPPVWGPGYYHPMHGVPEEVQYMQYHQPPYAPQGYFENQPYDMHATAQQQQQQQQQQWDVQQQQQQQWPASYPPAASQAVLDTPASPVRDTPLSPFEEAGRGPGSVHDSHMAYGADVAGEAHRPPSLQSQMDVAGSNRSQPPPVREWDGARAMAPEPPWLHPQQPNLAAMGHAGPAAEGWQAGQQWPAPPAEPWQGQPPPAEPWQGQAPYPWIAGGPAPTDGPAYANGAAALDQGRHKRQRQASEPHPDAMPMQPAPFQQVEGQPAMAQPEWGYNAVRTGNPELQEAMGVRHIADYIQALTQNLGASKAQDVLERLGQLHPVDALGVIAAVLQLCISHTDAACCNLLSQALLDLSHFSRHMAKQAAARYVSATAPPEAQPQQPVQLASDQHQHQQHQPSIPHQHQNQYQPQFPSQPQHQQQPFQQHLGHDAGPAAEGLPSPPLQQHQHQHQQLAGYNHHAGTQQLA